MIVTLMACTKSLANMTPSPIDEADWLPGFLVSNDWTWGSVTLENADMKELFDALMV